MKETTKLPFLLGFIVTSLAFVAVFAVNYKRNFDGLCMDCDNDFGWPFRVYQSGSLIHATQIIWSGIAANALVFIISSMVAGYICHFLWKQIKRSRIR